jgi:hypothetical protein
MIREGGSSFGSAEFYVLAASLVVVVAAAGANDEGWIGQHLPTTAMRMRPPITISRMAHQGSPELEAGAGCTQRLLVRS